MYHQSDADILKELRHKVNTCSLCKGRDLKCICYGEVFFALKILKANIPLKYRTFTLDMIVVPEAKQIVKQVRGYLEQIALHRQDGMGIYMQGNVGTGKSLLGCVVLIHALRKGYTSYFLNLDKYRSAVIEKDEEILYAAKNSEFLLIDDIGREFHDSKNFMDSLLDDLVRYRTDNLLPTLVTTNDDFIGTLRTESIIKEHFYQLHFKYNDYRAELQKQLSALAVTNEKKIGQDQGTQATIKKEDTTQNNNARIGAQKKEKQPVTKKITHSKKDGEGPTPKKNIGKRITDAQDCVVEDMPKI